MVLIKDIVCSVWNDDGTLFCSAEVDGWTDDTRVCFYVYRAGDEQPVFKTAYGKNLHFKYVAGMLGKYIVKAFVRNNITGEKISKKEVFDITKANAKLLSPDESPVDEFLFKWKPIKFKIVGGEVDYSIGFECDNRQYSLRYEHYYRGSLVGMVGLTRSLSVKFHLWGDGDYRLVCVFRDSATNKELRTFIEHKIEHFSGIENFFGRKIANVDYASSQKIASKSDSMKVLFTIDAEHNVGGAPIRLSGDLQKYGISENFGCPAIMDLFELFGLRAVFFLNVFEAESFDVEYCDYMKELIREIDKRGHEVALHCHGVPKELNAGVLFPYNNKNLSALGLDETVARIQAGMHFVKGCIGKAPISFRAGAYSINSDTLEALRLSGIKYDSSCYYGNSNNRMPYWRSVSKPVEECGIVEFPIVPVITGRGKSLLKLDFDVLSNEEIISALRNLRHLGINATQIMLHSFSFLRSFPIGRENKPLVIYPRGKECYGGNVASKEKMRKLLSILCNDNDFEVKTFEMLDKEGWRVNEASADGPALAATSNQVGRMLQHWQEYNVCMTKYVLKIPSAEDLHLEFLLYASHEVKNGTIIVKLVMKPWARGYFTYSFRLARNGSTNIHAQSIVTGIIETPFYRFENVDPGVYKCYYYLTDCHGNISSGVIRNIICK